MNPEKKPADNASPSVTNNKIDPMVSTPKTPSSQKANKSSQSGAKLTKKPKSPVLS